MDFLDPRKKNSRRRRLIISYILMGLLVITSATILIYSSFGYSINTKTGQIVQNGLVFVDSKPGGAKIYLNGIDTGQTTASRPILASPTRLVLQSGTYDLSLRAAGYRVWQDTFMLDSQTILRVDYPVLFPVSLNTQTLATYKTAPLFTTQSPDKHWLLVATSTAGGVEINQYDANDISKPAASLSLPASSVKLPFGSWRVPSWSVDGSSLLLVHTSGSKQEFVVLNRNKPASSFNLSDLVGNAVSQVVMRSGKADQFYTYQANTKQVSLYDIKSKKTTQLLKGVSSYSVFGQDQILYTTTSGAPVGSVLIKIWDGNNSYTLGQQKTSGVLLLATGSYQDNDYFVYGSAGDGNYYIFKNPLDSLRSASNQSPPAMATLRITGATSLDFSNNQQFIAAKSNKRVSTYNLDNSAATTFNIKYPLVSSPVWEDSFHLTGLSSSGNAYISDYNGANQQLLSSSNLPEGVYFDSVYQSMFSEQISKTSTKINITSLIVK